MSIIIIMSMLIEFNKHVFFFWAFSIRWRIYSFQRNIIWSTHTHTDMHTHLLWWSNWISIIIIIIIKVKKTDHHFNNWLIDHHFFSMKLNFDWINKFANRIFFFSYYSLLLVLFGEKNGQRKQICKTKKMNWIFWIEIYLWFD